MPNEEIYTFSLDMSNNALIPWNSAIRKAEKRHQQGWYMLGRWEGEREDQKDERPLEFKEYNPFWLSRDESLLFIQSLSGAV